MSYVNFNEKLLGLQGVEITDIKEFDRNLEIHIIQRGRAGRCPHCDTLCGTIHDYRNFERFRNRILHIFSEQKPSKQQTDVAPSCLHYV